MGPGGVKLLWDENLSYRLAPGLQQAFPGTAHLAAEGLSGADDWQVWCHARDNGFVLVTKDDDFVGLAARHGPPPTVVRLTLGNTSNAAVLELLNGQRAAIEVATTDPGVSLIEVGIGRWALRR